MQFQPPGVDQTQQRPQLPRVLANKPRGDVGYLSRLRAKLYAADKLLGSGENYAARWSQSRLARTKWPHLASDFAKLLCRDVIEPQMEGYESIDLKPVIPYIRGDMHGRITTLLLTVIERLSTYGLGTTEVGEMSDDDFSKHLITTISNHFQEALAEGWDEQLGDAGRRQLVCDAIRGLLHKALPNPANNPALPKTVQWLFSAFGSKIETGIINYAADYVDGAYAIAKRLHRDKDACHVKLDETSQGASKLVQGLAGLMIQKGREAGTLFDTGGVDGESQFSDQSRKLLHDTLELLGAAKEGKIAQVWQFGHGLLQSALNEIFLNLLDPGHTRRELAQTLAARFADDIGYFKQIIARRNAIANGGNAQAIHQVLMERQRACSKPTELHRAPSLQTIEEDISKWRGEAYAYLNQSLVEMVRERFINQGDLEYICVPERNKAELLSAPEKKEFFIAWATSVVHAIEKYELPPSLEDLDDFERRQLMYDCLLPNGLSAELTQAVPNLASLDACLRAEKQDFGILGAQGHFVMRFLDRLLVTMNTEGLAEQIRAVTDPERVKNYNKELLVIMRQGAKASPGSEMKRRSDGAKELLKQGRQGKLKGDEWTKQVSLFLTRPIFSQMARGLFEKELSPEQFSHLFPSTLPASTAFNILYDMLGDYMREIYVTVTDLGVKAERAQVSAGAQVTKEIHGLVERMSKSVLEQMAQTALSKEEHVTDVQLEVNGEILKLDFVNRAADFCFLQNATNTQLQAKIKTLVKNAISVVITGRLKPLLGDLAPLERQLHVPTEDYATEELSTATEEFAKLGLAAQRQRINELMDSYEMWGLKSEAIRTSAEALRVHEAIVRKHDDMTEKALRLLVNRLINGGKRRFPVIQRDLALFATWEQADQTSSIRDLARELEVKISSKDLETVEARIACHKRLILTRESRQLLSILLPQRRFNELLPSFLQGAGIWRLAAESLSGYIEAASAETVQLTKLSSKHAAMQADGRDLSQKAPQLKATLDSLHAYIVDYVRSQMQELHEGMDGLPVLKRIVKGWAHGDSYIIQLLNKTLPTLIETAVGFHTMPKDGAQEGKGSRSERTVDLVEKLLTLTNQAYAQADTIERTEDAEFYETELKQVLGAGAEALVNHLLPEQELWRDIVAPELEPFIGRKRILPILTAYLVEGYKQRQLFLKDAQCGQKKAEGLGLDKYVNNALDLAIQFAADTSQSKEAQLENQWLDQTLKAALGRESLRDKIKPLIMTTVHALMNRLLKGDKQADLEALHTLVTAVVKDGKMPSGREELTAYCQKLEHNDLLAYCQAMGTPAGDEPESYVSMKEAELKDFVQWHIGRAVLRHLMSEEDFTELLPPTARTLLSQDTLAKFIAPYIIGANGFAQRLNDGGAAREAEALPIDLKHYLDTTVLPSVKTALKDQASRPGQDFVTDLAMTLLTSDSKELKPLMGSLIEKGIYWVVGQLVAQKPGKTATLTLDALNEVLALRSTGPSREELEALLAHKPGEKLEGLAAEAQKRLNRIATELVNRLVDLNAWNALLGEPLNTLFKPSMAASGLTPLLLETYTSMYKLSDRAETARALTARQRNFDALIKQLNEQVDTVVEGLGSGDKKLATSLPAMIDQIVKGVLAAGSDGLEHVGAVRQQLIGTLLHARLGDLTAKHQDKRGTKAVADLASDIAHQIQRIFGKIEQFEKESVDQASPQQQLGRLKLHLAGELDALFSLLLPEDFYADCVPATLGPSIKTSIEGSIADYLKQVYDKRAAFTAAAKRGRAVAAESQLTALITRNMDGVLRPADDKKAEPAARAQSEIMRFVFAPEGDFNTLAEDAVYAVLGALLHPEKSRRYDKLQELIATLLPKELTAHELKPNQIKDLAAALSHRILETPALLSKGLESPTHTLGNLFIPDFLQESLPGLLANALEAELKQLNRVTQQLHQKSEETRASLKEGVQEFIETNIVAAVHKYLDSIGNDKKPAQPNEGLPPELEALIYGVLRQADSGIGKLVRDVSRDAIHLIAGRLLAGDKAAIQKRIEDVIAKVTHGKVSEVLDILITEKEWNRLFLTEKEMQEGKQARLPRATIETQLADYIAGLKATQGALKRLSDRAKESVHVLDASEKTEANPHPISDMIDATVSSICAAIVNSGESKDALSKLFAGSPELDGAVKALMSAPEESALGEIRVTLVEQLVYTLVGSALGEVTIGDDGPYLSVVQKDGVAAAKTKLAQLMIELLMPKDSQAERGETLVETLLPTDLRALLFAPILEEVDGKLETRPNPLLTLLTPQNLNAWFLRPYVEDLQFIAGGLLSKQRHIVPDGPTSKLEEFILQFLPDEAASSAQELFGLDPEGLLGTLVKAMTRGESRQHIQALARGTAVHVGNAWTARGREHLLCQEGLLPHLLVSGLAHLRNGAEAPADFPKFERAGFDPKLFVNGSEEQEGLADRLLNALIPHGREKLIVKPQMTREDLSEIKQEIIQLVSQLKDKGSAAQKRQALEYAGVALNEDADLDQQFKAALDDGFAQKVAEKYVEDRTPEASRLLDTLLPSALPLPPIARASIEGMIKTQIASRIAPLVGSPEERMTTVLSYLGQEVPKDAQVGDVFVSSLTSALAKRIADTVIPQDRRDKNLIMRFFHRVVNVLAWIAVRLLASGGIYRFLRDESTGEKLAHVLWKVATDLRDDPLNARLSEDGAQRQAQIEQRREQIHRDVKDQVRGVIAENDIISLLSGIIGNAVGKSMSQFADKALFDVRGEEKKEPLQAKAKVKVQIPAAKLDMLHRWNPMDWFMIDVKV